MKDDLRSDWSDFESPARASTSKSWGRSPILDLRALGSSLLFHATVLIVASLVVLGVAMPQPRELPHVLRGELGPVDNLAPAETGGGGPGERGGQLNPDSVRVSADGRSAESQSARDPAADALLSEVLPATTSAEMARRAPPGPLSAGVGVLPGPGSGGGGGEGGGSNGGIGGGVGPGTEFFGAREHGGSFAYVIDCSGSMANHDSLTVAKRELLASLAQLPPDAKFAVVFYSNDATIFADAAGKNGLMAATAENKARVRTRLATIDPDGGTNHMVALKAALALNPEVIFFLTDADLMSMREASEILDSATSTRIQSVEFGVGPDLGESAPLRRLATATGGNYRYIDVTTFRDGR